ncbi:MAG: agmatinase [Chloroflexota bacterium]
MTIQTMTDVQTLKKYQIAVLGIPFDDNSSFLRGPAGGPAEIRKQLHCGSANYFAEDGTNIDGGQVIDIGDVDFRGDADWLKTIENRALQAIDQEARLLTLGGDHSITWPLVRAHAKRYEKLTILQIDAHPDLYDELDGNRHAHACPFARIMEEGLVDRLVQIGIRTLNNHQSEQAERFGVEIIEMKDWSACKLPEVEGPLYLTLDLDGLDPAYAPGVSHHEPGGFSAREVINIIQNLPPVLVGADIVELNPVRDHHGMTAMVGAKLLREAAAKLSESIPMA